MHKPAPSECTLTGRRPQPGASSSETAVLHGPRHAIQMLRIWHMLSEGKCAPGLHRGSRSHSEAPAAAVHSLQSFRGYGHAIVLSFTYLVLVVIARWHSVRHEAGPRFKIGPTLAMAPVYTCMCKRATPHMLAPRRRIRFASSFSDSNGPQPTPLVFMRIHWSCYPCLCSVRNCPGRTPDTRVRKHSAAVAVAVTSDLMRW